MGNAASVGEFGVGLLEQPALTVLVTRTGRHGIFGSDGCEVGFAQWQRRAWYYAPQLSVHEWTEAPLVFTITRRWCWPRSYEVFDAESERVGEVGRRRIQDRWGECVMVADRNSLSNHPQGSGLWRDMRGEGLAAWYGTDLGLRLEFLPSVRHDPFACMLLLSAVLLYP